MLVSNDYPSCQHMSHEVDKTYNSELCDGKSNIGISWQIAGLGKFLLRFYQQTWQSFLKEDWSDKKVSRLMQIKLNHPIDPSRSYIFGLRKARLLSGWAWNWKVGSGRVCKFCRRVIRNGRNVIIICEFYTLHEWTSAFSKGGFYLMPYPYTFCL